MADQPGIGAQIAAFNRGREPERLALKYRAIGSSAFAFLRGTCHLFYAHLPDHELLARAPLAWSCGDLHLENFGTYKGDNRLVYFDLNDFDEGALAPCTWDPLRLLASILVAAPGLKLERAGARRLAARCLESYRTALAAGRARWIDRDGAEGLIADLFARLKERKRQEYVASWTEMQGKRRRLRTDGQRALTAGDQEREQVQALMEAFARTQANPDFFRPLDVARRIAGTGSLGLARFVVLVEGKGGAAGHYLLDLKQAQPSALAPHLPVPQPAWPSEAARVVAIQERLQAVSPAFLKPVELAGQPFVLKALQPSQDRVNLSGSALKAGNLDNLVADFGRLTAWAQLRASGRQGAAGADALMAFAADGARLGALLPLAEQCAELVQQQWQEFRAAPGAGAG